ncbi:MAG TPA: ATP-binding cassette domain-containing protein [Kofleriaceae bacterium]|nr:ATP-binding cassette domain-containing protein [Kofleriaceae bacterium]
MTAAAAPIVECRGVTVGYDPERPTLTGIDLRIDAGEIVVLLGPSGCGKSTLLRTLTGLMPPIAGEVLLFGEPFYQLTGDERRALLRRTGTLFQQDALFGSMTIGDNVELPLRETTRLPGAVIREMAAIKLGLVGLAGLGHRSPSQLSGGQRKRAALARATVLDPELVLCDEPSAGLDPTVAAGIDQTFLRLRALFGSAFVVVTHEIESARTIADRALVLAGGRIRAAGTIAELVDSTDPVVRGFFHRAPPEAARAAATRTP